MIIVNKLWSLIFAGGKTKKKKITQKFELTFEYGPTGMIYEKIG